MKKQQRSQSQIQADGMPNGDSPARVGLYEKSPNKPSTAHKSFAEHKKKFPSLKNLFSTKANDGTSFLLVSIFEFLFVAVCLRRRLGGCACVKHLHTSLA